MVEINLCDAVYSREGKRKEEGSWGVSSIGERLRRRGVCGRLRRGDLSEGRVCNWYDSMIVVLLLWRGLMGLRGRSVSY